MQILTLATFVVGTLASHVLHEKRNFVPAGWERGERLEGHKLMPMRIALTQQNIDSLDSHLADVSDPASPNFSQHWTPKKIAEHFAPSEETRNAVLDWIVASGIEKERLVDSLSQSLGWLHFDITVSEAEALLQTKYWNYHHGGSGKIQYGVEEYSVPAKIQHHIDFITPTLHFDAKVYEPVEKRDLEDRAVSPLGKPGSYGLPKYQYVAPNISSIFAQLKDCSRYITPVCLQALYLIPPPLTNIQKTPLGIVEYTPQSYLQSDLNTFFANFSANQRQKTPTLVSIDGGFVNTVGSLDLNVESNLDLEFAMTLANPISVTLYQVGDAEEGASFNDFLDALDASYCTFEGGDDPSQDATYPDPLPGGYKGPKQCGGAAVAKVISTSYAYNEADLTPFYENRQCQEYAKLGLLGTSVLYSSGDYGVAGNSGQCIDPATGQYNDGTSGKFNPSFPATCPYVTSVGATYVPPGGSVTQPEQACETVIYSGGGFSNVFPLPSYQAKAVTSYLKNYPPPYTSDRYNNTGKVRAFPDISANGANYLTVIDGKVYHVYGTSASSPVSAAIIAIINEYRAAIGKKSLGFLNPTFYAHPQIFNDITIGGNQGCGTPGFSSAPGWDPVTGLGTPNTPKVLALALSLP